MIPERQLRVLTKIWGRGHDGYVFLPWIDGDATNKAERKSGYHEGKAFHWPTDKEKIVEHIANHQDDDLYFTPCLFNAKRRLEDLADSERRLWADLDETTPQQCVDKGYRPTIVWETSPGRYQAVWCLNGFKNGASWPGMENHRLTSFLEADPGGWDTTQLLRVPGHKNHKPIYKAENDGEPYQGKLVWENGALYLWEDFDDLPEIKGVSDSSDDLLDEKLLEGIDRHAVWQKVRLKVSQTVREYMGVRTVDEGTVDRSEVVWQIERDLADAGCSMAEIIALVRPTPWNKYDGRNDELKRLRLEVSKALSFKKDDTVLEEIDDGPKPEGFIDFSQDPRFVVMKRPKWLVKDIFTEGACGFIAAPPKHTKSWMGLDLAYSVSRGLKFLDRPILKPGNVLYIQQEDPKTLVKDRLGKIADGKEENCHWQGQLIRISRSRFVWEPPAEVPGQLDLEIMEGFKASDLTWQDWLDEMVGKNKVILCIIDTLMTVAGDTDTDKAKEIKAKILDPMKVIGRKYNCAMIFIHHNRKAGDSARGGQNMAGSNQIHAWSDCAIYIRDKKDNYSTGSVDLKLEIETKYTGSKLLNFRVDWEDGLWIPEPIVKSVGEVIYEEEGPHRRRTKPSTVRKQNNIQKVEALLKDKPNATDKDIQDLLGVSQATANRYKNRAKTRDE